MTSGQKIAFSFLIAMATFAAFIFVSIPENGLLSKLETRFYKQAKVAEKQEQLSELTQSCDSYISNILFTIETGDTAYLKSNAVKSYVHQDASEKDENDRRNLTSQLFYDLPGLDGMRLIEKNGRNVHFSTYESDIFRENGIKRSYKKYNDIQSAINELDAETILVNPEKPEHKLLLDKNHSRMIISFPLYITDNTYFATLVTYFNLKDFELALLNQGHITIGDSFTLIADEESFTGGFVLGIPRESQSEFIKPVEDAWKTQNSSDFTLEPILSNADKTWCLMEGPAGKFFNVSAVYLSDTFEFSSELKYLIYVSVFITVFLVAFLLFSLKRDYLTVIKSRIKKIQFGIINEYLENKEKVEWSQVAKQFEHRKQELSDDIKKEIGGKSKKYSKQVDAYLDSSWADIISVLKAQDTSASGNLSGASIEEIRRVIEDVLKTAKLNVAVAPGAVAASSGVQEYIPPVKTKAAPAEVEEVEAIEEVDEIDEIDEIEDVAAVEEVEKLDEVEVIEEVEEAEELDEIDEVEVVEEVDEVEDIEEAGEVEVVEEIEDVEAVDEVEVIEDEGEIEEVESLDEVDETEEIASVDDIVEPLEEVEDVEEFEEVENLDELEDIEEIEEVEEIEPLGDIPVMPSIPVMPIMPVMGGPSVHFDYVRSNDTFIGADDDIFATVDDVFAEALAIGCEYTSLENESNKEFNFIPVKFTFVKNEEDEIEAIVEAETVDEPEVDVELEAVVEAVDEAVVEAETVEEAEVLEPEAAEDLEPVEEQPFFSMTSFAANYDNVTELLEEGEEVTIVENNGVYSIAEDLPYTKTDQDPAFKKLVDSVLR